MKGFRAYLNGELKASNFFTSKRLRKVVRA